ncbi:MAG: hypothetical protein ACREYC_24535 [Gammaproteobacteria bacterium]
MKSAVLEHLIGQAPVFNSRYLDFAHHYGFTIAACGVRKGNEKGRVERGVGYVKKNFLNGLDLADFSAMNPAARIWLDTTANVRLHGEPRTLLEQRRNAREQKLLMRFLTLSPKAQDYYQGLRQRRFNPGHHLRKIVALSDIYGAEGVARAMEDAFTFQAFSCEYIANLLEIEVPEPNLSVYEGM